MTNLIETILRGALAEYTSAIEAVCAFIEADDTDLLSFDMGAMYSAPRGARVRVAQVRVGLENVSRWQARRMGVA